MMLWYKSWLETRWRFVIGLAVLLCSAAGVVFQYPRASELLSQMPGLSMGGEIGRRIQEAVELSREYRGYVWLQAFRQNLAQVGTLFAVLLGTGGFLQFSKGTALFTLSLPASRDRMLGIRTAVGLAQWLALAMLPCVLITLLSPIIGEQFGLGSAIAHGLCLFIAGTVLFSLAVLLSTVFGDVWRPLLFSLLAAGLAAIPAQIHPPLSPYTLSGLMSGETIFRMGQLPWVALLGAALLSAGLLYAAARNLQQRDF